MERKRILELTAGIISIVFGSIYALYGFITFAIATESFNFEPFSIIYLFEFFAGIISIVVGAMLCPGSDRNGVYKNNKGLNISLIILGGACVLFFIIKTSIPYTRFMAWTLLPFFIAIALTTLAAIALASKYDAPKSNPYGQPNNPYGQPNYGAPPQPNPYGVPQQPTHYGIPQQPCAPPQAPQSPSCAAAEQKLAILKNLKAEGSISDEDYSAAVSKIIDNM